MDIKAKFTQLTAKQGKAVVQFEVDEACAWALPELAQMAGSQVVLSVVDPQTRIELDAGPLPFGGLLPEEARAVDAEDVGGAGERDEVEL